MENPVRQPEQADVPSAVRTLRRAFADYPFTRHTIDADDHERRLERFHELFLTRIGMEHGSVRVAGPVGDVRAVAVWTTPRTDAGHVFTELAPRFAELAGNRAQCYEEAEAAMAPHRPTAPAWFLGAVGVDPGHQGRGLGGAVVRPGITAAEQEGAVAFLETSEERNVGFYQRLGFTVEAEFPLPHDGPWTWSMLRRPYRAL
ncbi:acetyltransferase (GNAT) family protein [Haloactinospora alba]|uniref:Acetyltransferase (GNAT) family protein n=1 Tax=Haloactinospora alba TaxID=405555 RepID=A0A543NGJ3_9ACTN|nr:acetyltransferase (GNAT) family protein [Haloactinospora alba]